MNNWALLSCATILLEYICKARLFSRLGIETQVQDNQVICLNYQVLLPITHWTGASEAWWCGVTGVFSSSPSTGGGYHTRLYTRTVLIILIHLLLFPPFLPVSLLNIILFFPSVSSGISQFPHSFSSPTFMLRPTFLPSFLLIHPAL